MSLQPSGVLGVATTPPAEPLYWFVGTLQLYAGAYPYAMPLPAMLPPLFEKPETSRGRWRHRPSGYG